MKRHLYSAQPGKHLEKTTLANSIDFSPVGNKKKKIRVALMANKALWGFAVILLC